MIQINDSNFGNILLIEAAIIWPVYLILYSFLKRWFKKRGKSLKNLAFKFAYPFILLSSLPFWLVKVNGKNITFWDRLALIFPIFILAPFILHWTGKSARVSFRKSMGWRQCEEDMDDNDEKKIDNK